MKKCRWIYCLILVMLAFSLQGCSSPTQPSLTTNPISTSTSDSSTSSPPTTTITPATTTSQLQPPVEIPAHVEKLYPIDYELINYRRILAGEEAAGNLMPLDTLVALSQKGTWHTFHDLYADVIQYRSYVDAPLIYYITGGYVWVVVRPSDPEEEIHCRLEYYGETVDVCYAVEGLDHIADFVSFIQNWGAKVPEKPNISSEKLDALIRAFKLAYPHIDFYMCDKADYQAFGGDARVISFGDPTGDATRYMLLYVYLYVDAQAMADDIARIKVNESDIEYDRAFPKTVVEKYSYLYLAHIFKGDHFILTYGGHPYLQDDKQVFRILCNYLGKPLINPDIFEYIAPVK
jgi:hypothetical protein